MVNQEKGKENKPSTYEQIGEKLMELWKLFPVLFLGLLFWIVSANTNVKLYYFLAKGSDHV